MKVKERIILWIILPAVFIAGYFGNVLFTLPNKYFQKEINIIELLNLFVTIIIAFLIPMFIGKFLDDNKSIKSCLIDELKIILTTLSHANDVIIKAHQKKSFTQKDRDTIVWIETETELQITSFQKQIEVAFKKESTKTCESLKKCVPKYMSFLTGGDLMLSSFKKVDTSFLRLNKIAFSNAQTDVKTLIQEIYKF